MEESSVTYELKGEEVLCPTIINISLDDVKDIHAYFDKNSGSLNEDWLIFEKMLVHLKNGAKIKFLNWFSDETIFIDEPMVGFSGPNKAKVEIVFVKRSLL